MYNNWNLAPWFMKFDTWDRIDSRILNLNCNFWKWLYIFKNHSFKKIFENSWPKIKLDTKFQLVVISNDRPNHLPCFTLKKTSYILLVVSIFIGRVVFFYILKILIGYLWTVIYKILNIWHQFQIFGVDPAIDIDTKFHESRFQIATMTDIVPIFWRTLFQYLTYVM